MKIVFLDLDGVLADLERGLQEELGVTREDMEDKGRLFRKYLPEYVDLKGFETQAPLDGAHELVDFLVNLRRENKIEIGILTSSGHFYTPNSEVVEQKKRFLEINFPQLNRIPFCVTTSGKDKALFANEYSMLIDDRLKNVEHFREAGGYAYWYDDSNHVDVYTSINEFVN